MLWRSWRSVVTSRRAGSVEWIQERLGGDTKLERVSRNFFKNFFWLFFFYKWMEGNEAVAEGSMGV